jgi:threonylcarbamoyladenosine tRNA methylthiotransferase MtaB
MPKFRITTLGCKVNQAESDSLAQDLITSGWFPTQAGEQADVCIINTCTVTQKASMQSRQAIRQAIRVNPNAKIAATGCYAQTSPQDIDRIDGVHYIVGQGEKHRIVRILRTDADRASDSTVSTCTDNWQKGQFDLTPTAITTPRTRPFLKIQDGCDAYCTYCIVPYARGCSRSIPLGNVLQGIEDLAQSGFHEVVLTGIHLGAYGHDLAPATNLMVLLERIEHLKPITRVRISSIEPFELTGEIIQCMAEADIFCKHFHIPLQSGDDMILRKMGRPYSRGDFYKLITNIHSKIPNASIGVDTLIGFPGESETAFKSTYELVAELPISYLHVFPFSSRPGTKAAKLPDKVNLGTIRDRCQQIRSLGDEKRMKFYRKFIGTVQPVLIETGRDRFSGLLKGITSNYLPVLTDGDDHLKNNIVDVNIQKLERDKLFGRCRPTV